MKQETIWRLATVSVGLFAACEVQPDWSDIARQLEENKMTTSGGTDSTTSGAAGTDPTGSGGTAGTGNGIGSGGTPSTTMGSGGNPATGGAPAGGPGGMPVGSGGTPGMGGVGGTGGAMVGPDAGGRDAAADKRAMDLIELKDALKNLHGFVYMNPCKFGNAGQDVTTLAGCNTGDICWATADLGRFAENRMIAIGGVAGHVYDVDVNVLGVIEPRDYPPAPNCTFAPAQPGQTISVAKCMDGFANSSSVTFNVYEFSIAAPAAKFYFNAVITHPPHRVDVGDNKFTFTVNAASSIRFNFDDLNGGEIRNCTNSIAKSKYTLAANSPFGDSTAILAPSSVAQPYNGNWFAISVIDARVR